MNGILRKFLEKRGEVELKTTSAQPTDPMQVEDALVGVLPTELMRAWTAIHDFLAELEAQRVEVEELAVAILADEPSAKMKRVKGSRVRRFLINRNHKYPALLRAFQGEMERAPAFRGYQPQIKAGTHRLCLRANWNVVLTPVVKSTPEPQVLGS